MARQKVNLRVSAELALVEILRFQSPSSSGSKTGESSTAGSTGSPGQEWLFTVLRDLLSSDREHANTSIVITLLKAFGPHLLGPSQSTAGPEGSSSAHDEVAIRSAAESDGISAQGQTSSAPALIEPNIATRFRKLSETYFATLCKRIVREHEHLQEQDRRNHEAYIKSGEIFEDRQQKYEKMTKAFERALESGKSLSELLDVPMPTLTDSSKSASTGLAINLDASSSLRSNDRTEEDFAVGKSPWEDDDTRRFYEDILDLKDVIPPALLGVSHEGGPEDKTEGNAISPQLSPTLEQREFNPIEGHNSAGASPDLGGQKQLRADEQMQAGPAAQLSTLLARLPDSTNRALIDSAAVDFALMNSKAARRRLVKQLASVPRHRTDVLSYYARLVATLNPYMPDVGKGIVDTLDEEFRWLQKKKTTELSESRVKNARFLAELTKFAVTPLHTIFHCFKVCLDDFSGPNIEVLATLVEYCGRFLLRTEATAERMRSLLEMMRRKRAAKNLDHRQVLLLDNAYYQCNPPERKIAQVKQRSHMELYLRHLIYDELNRRTVSKVVKLLRKIQWSDPQIQTILFELFTRIWRIKFSHIHLLAVLLADLQPYHQDFVISIIDHVCEDIRFGMEINLFKLNQRRVAMVVYLGELYNYRLVSSGIIFDQLWTFITFGHPNGRPLPGQTASMDAPDDFFRLRLVCSLLDCCGVCFDKGSLRKRLDEYLAFLNLYVLSKDQPLPMDIDFMLSDTLEILRPKLVLKKDWDEATKVADEILARQQAKASAKAGKNGTQQQEVHEEESDSDDDDSDAEEAEGEEGEGGEHKRVRPRNEVDREEEGVAEGEGSDSDEEGESDDADSDATARASDGEEEEDEHVVRRKAQQSQAELEAEEEFARELAKMMTEGHSSASAGAAGGGIASRGNPSQQSRSLFEQGLPFIRRGANGNEATQSSANGTTAVAEGQMRFDLLTKRGNKVQTSALHLPSDSAIAVTTREKQMKELQERKLLKEYVLGYEGREESEERMALEQSLGRRGFKMRPGQGQR